MKHHATLNAPDRTNSGDIPWIVVTGQRWKTWWFGCAIVLALGGFVIFLRASDDAVYLGQRVQNWGLEGGMAVGIMGFAWLVVSVRCAGCGGHPAWYLMRKAEVGKWFTLLVSLLACPMCGRRPENQGGGNTQRVMSSRVG